MSRFELPLETRRNLCGAGFHDVDAALRAAAVELDLWFFVERLHWGARSDGAFRHYTNFLAWTDTTAIGINRAINRSGHQSLIAPWQARVKGDVVMLFRSFDGSWPGELIGQSTDYLWWLRDTALPLVLEAITLGARGDTVVDHELPLAEQMAFPHADPWTTTWDPELSTLLGLDLDAEA